ncbi:hypothetical protein JCM12141A_57290 [Mycolicibacterium hodleri]
MHYIERFSSAGVNERYGVKEFTRLRNGAVAVAVLQPTTPATQGAAPTDSSNDGDVQAH